MGKGVLSSSVLAEQEHGAEARSTTVPLSVYVDRGNLARLDEIAAESGMTRSAVFAKVVLRGKVHVEAAYRKQIAQKQFEQEGYADDEIHQCFMEAEEGRRKEAERQERMKRLRSDPDYPAARKELQEIEEKARQSIWRRILQRKDSEKWVEE